jgi:hypothetical protein
MDLAHSPAARPRPRRLAWFVGLVGLTVLAIGGYIAWSLIQPGLPPTSTPYCSWPLHVDGRANREQAGLIRCYVRALAHHDPGGLLTLAYTVNGPVRITAKDFKHAADARTGIATATFVPGENDYAYAVTIVFADHVRETIAIAPGNPGNLHAWRLEIGTLAAHKFGPPSTKPSP